MKSKTHVALAGLLALANTATAQKSPDTAAPPTLTAPGAPGTDVTKMRTLHQVEPRIPINAETCAPDNANYPGEEAVYRITAPGSYYLTGNLIGKSGQHGITINLPAGAPDDFVSIDLNGFRLVGVTGSRAGIAGALADSHVRNGFASGWGSRGISAFTVVDVTASDNGWHGIEAQTIARRCVASNNTGDGILAWTSAEDCTADGNTQIGISGLSPSGLFRNNVCKHNTNGGLVASGRIEGNHLFANGVFGLAAGNGSFVVKNSAFKNGPAGARNNYEIDAGNFVGEIIKATATASDISGTTTSASGLGASNAAVTSPWANFSD